MSLDDVPAGERTGITIGEVAAAHPFDGWTLRRDAPPEERARVREQRLAAVDCLLAQVDFTFDKTGALVFLAAQLASGRGYAELRDAARRVDAQRPGLMARTAERSVEFKSPEVAALLRAITPDQRAPDTRAPSSEDIA